MGGAVNVVARSLSAEFAPPEAANQNAVPAMWLSYNAIRCVTPPWDLHTDDDLAHGGKQVTVFVTNDGARTGGVRGDVGSARGGRFARGGPAAATNGEGSGTETPLPSRSGDGATFTYFDAAKFRDAPRFLPRVAVGGERRARGGGGGGGGGPASTVGFGLVRFTRRRVPLAQRRVRRPRFAREWHFNDTRLEATDDSGGLVFLGEHVETAAWYEVVAEGPSTSGGGSTRAR